MSENAVETMGVDSLCGVLPSVGPSVASSCPRCTCNDPHPKQVAELSSL